MAAKPLPWQQLQRHGSRCVKGSFRFDKRKACCIVSGQVGLGMVNSVQGGCPVDELPALLASCPLELRPALSKKDPARQAMAHRSLPKAER